MLHEIAKQLLKTLNKCILLKELLYKIKWYYVWGLMIDSNRMHQLIPITDDRHYLYSTFQNHSRTFLFNRTKFHFLLSITFVSNRKRRGTCTKIFQTLYIRFTQNCVFEYGISIPKKSLVRLTSTFTIIFREHVIISETRINSLH